ncbi:MAG: hypothetical protein ACXIUZ_00635 [Lysobacteraceae bacterium]
MTELNTPGFKLPDEMRETLERLRDLATLFTKASVTFSAGFREVFASLEKMQQQFPDPFLVLGREGWYPDPESTYSDLCWVSDAMEAGRREAAVEWLMAYYRSHLDAIEGRLTQGYPHRSAPLAQSFAAHRREDYFLSVPAFLIQTDGICQELTNGLQAFSQSPKRGIGPHFSKLADSGHDSLTMKPLLDGTLPLTRSDRDRGPDFVGLNRHAVLHGTDLNYGTEENSLKALSVLNFLALMLPLWKEDMALKAQEEKT